MMLLICLSLLLSLGRPAWAALPRYEIEAAYLDQNRQIKGQIEITFLNNGTRPLSAIHLVLYPNIYRKKQDALGPLFYQNAYPKNFNPGGMQIKDIRAASGEALSATDSGSSGGIKIQVPKPVLPGEDYRFSLHFTTQIPEKRGVFGQNKDLVTLQGGWHPYLAAFSEGKWQFESPPQAADFRIRLTLGSQFTLSGSRPAILTRSKAKQHTFLMEGEALPFFSLSIGQNLKRLEIKEDSVSIRYHALEKDLGYAREVSKVAKAALRFFLGRSGPLPPSRIEMAEAYLHQDLVASGINMLYLSNRFFKVFTSLKRFHEASLARGLFQVLWHQKRPEEEWWVIECLAKHDAEAFMLARHQKNFNLDQWLKPIGFIPLIDQILYSSGLPMRQVYFREAVVPIVSEDLRFFNNPPSESPNIFSKLGDLYGMPVLERAISIYRAQQSEHKKTFRKVLPLAGAKGADQWIKRWLSVRPKLDFEIAGIQREEDGRKYQTTILLRKHGQGVEPLKILIQEEEGDLHPFTWDGEGDTHTLALETDHPIEKIALDPHKFTNDPVRLNNQDPKPWKVLLDQFRANYDFQTRFFSYRAGFLFQHIYDTRNWVNLLFSHAETGNLGHLGYTHTLKQNHRLTGGFTYETLEPSQVGQDRQEAGFVNLGYAFVFPDIPLLSESMQRLTATFPAFNVGLSYNQAVTGGSTQNAFLLGIDFRRTFSFSNYHEIGTRVFIGQSTGSLFKESRFFLGGSDGMRGFSPLVFSGENIALVSAEYRFPLFYDTDINFAGLAHSHAWQGVLFMDTGEVSNSHHVFRFKEYRSDIGAGLRFYADLFGVYPSILRIDVAVPIASPIEGEQFPHYYLNFGHSF